MPVAVFELDAQGQFLGTSWRAPREPEMQGREREVATRDLEHGKAEQDKI